MIQRRVLNNLSNSELIKLLSNNVYSTASLTAFLTAWKLDDLAAPDDNTDLNASTSKHGLMMKYPNTASGKFLDESGGWSVPPGGSAAEAIITMAGSDATASEQAAATASGGIVCDGTADQSDLATIVATLTGTRMQIVRLVGTFSISAPMVMGSYMILDTSSATVNLANASNCAMLTASSKTNFEVIGGKWNGNLANQTPSGAERCRGFEFSSCDHFAIRKSEIYSIKKFSSGGGCCIYLSTCNDATVENTHCHDSGDSSLTANGNAIGCYGNCARIKFLNNTIHDTDGGFYIYGTSGQVNCNHIIANNNIYNITRDGISLYNQDHAAGVITRITVANNVIESAGLDADHPSIVIGNHGPANHITVVGNVCVGSTSYTEGGIYVMGNNNIVADNVIKDTLAGQGILLQDHVGDGTTGWYNIVKGNYIYQANTTAIYITSGSYNIVSDNYIYDPSARGIWINSGDYNTCRGNYIYSSGSYWCDIEAGADYNVIELNHAISCAASISDSGTGTNARYNIES